MNRTIPFAARAIKTPISKRFASTKSVSRIPVYTGGVYWGKAWKDVGGTFLLYVPLVSAVMFWPMPIAPLMNRSKGIKKGSVAA